jgi:hypothetical protein
LLFCREPAQILNCATSHAFWRLKKIDRLLTTSAWPSDWTFECTTCASGYLCVINTCPLQGIPLMQTVPRFLCYICNLSPGTKLWIWAASQQQRVPGQAQLLPSLCHLPLCHV